MPHSLPEPVDPEILERLSEPRREQIAAMSRAFLHHGRLQRLINDRAAAATGLPHMHYAILLALATTDLSRMSELAEYYNLDISVVSRHVSAMETAGHVTRVRCETDGRAVRVRMTPTGCEVLERTRMIYRSRLAQLTEDWADDDIDTFVSFLSRLLKSANGMDI
ncbi:MAG: MarR family winged helix-turn-helix transcriptional regulator [Ancrocorticia sp.]